MLANEMLKEMRSKAGYTQEEVAKQLHISRTTYVQYETGKRAITADMFFKVTRMFDVGFSLNHWKEAFFQAVEDGDIDTVKMYTEKGINIEEVNSQGERPFLVACINNQPDILQYLIEQGSPYHSSSDSNWEEYAGASKLFSVLLNGYLKVAKVLMDSDLDLSNDLNFLTGVGMGFLPLKSRLFLQFKTSGETIPLEKIEELAQKLNGVMNKDLVKEHAYMIDGFAKKYQDKGVTLDVLKEAAQKGLEKAAERYDPDKGFLFKTYCQWWIRQTIVRAIAEDSGLPVYLYDYYEKMKRFYEEELENTGEERTKEEIAKRFELDMNIFDKIESRYTGTVFWKK